MILLLVYVDDVILTGNNNSLIQDLIASLDKQFASKDLGCLSYFLGFQVNYLDSGFILNQETYVTDLLHKLKLNGLKPAPLPVLSLNESFVILVARGHLVFCSTLVMISLSLLTHSNADLAANIDNRKSVAAYCVFLGVNLVSWSSKKQTIVVRSSTKSEYRAFPLAASEIIWLKQLLEELHISQSQKPVLWV
ncbi:hypothetical protein IC582_021052 [Cucumis melo]